MSCSTSTEKKMLTLKTCDGEEFEVEQKVAVLSETIKNMVEDDCSSGIIPLPNVCAHTLSTVLEYCKKHAEEDGAKNDKETKAFKKELKAFDKKLVNDLELYELYDAMMAANYLSIKGFLDVLCQKVADMIKGKTPEEIRQTFNIKNDFSPEEQAEVNKENAWVLE